MKAIGEYSASRESRIIGKLASINVGEATLYSIFLLICMISVEMFEIPSSLQSLVYHHFILLEVCVLISMFFSFLFGGYFIVCLFFFCFLVFLSVFSSFPGMFASTCVCSFVGVSLLRDER